MKSAVFERQQGQISTALSTLATALSKYPKFAKLYMIQGQIQQSQMDYTAARTSYATGIKACPKEVTLWILASKLEEADGKSIKARALLEKARLVNPTNDLLWAEAVGVEERSGGAAQAKAVLARGKSCLPFLYHDGLPEPFHLFHRSPRLPDIGATLVIINMGRTTAHSKVSIRRCSEEVRR